MKKQRAKTALQKRRAKFKAKARAEEQKRGNWVQDQLDWVNILDNNDEVFEDDADDTDSKFSLHDDIDDSDSLTSTDYQPLNNEVGEEQLLRDISIISWNVLADAYCSRSSHKNLPSKFQSRVFNRNQRQHQVRQTLRLFDTKLSPDMITLQEVDPPLEGKKGCKCGIRSKR